MSPKTGEIPTLVTFAPTTSGEFTVLVGTNGQSVVWISLATLISR